MKNRAIQTLKLNSVSISNLSSINGGLQANNNNNQPVKGAPSTSGPSLECGYSNGCHTKGCANG
ncbi:MAG: hypothetical protein AB8B65_07800 [Kordia sp.]|uniref:hypothetical protein n=1 Tax=Kordia sp. TaxID=1965332 RepID=UPI00385E56BF